MEPTNFRAWVAQPNTPETDKEEFVNHRVNYEVENQTISTEVIARDPIEAIEKVKENLKSETT